MKTPREILLGRHEAAELELSRACSRALAELPRRRGTPAPGLFAGWWRMPRMVWVPLAAAWIVIIGLNAVSHETDSRSATPARAAINPDNRRALREQKQLFAELVGSAPAAAAEPPRFIPKPRGETKPALSFA